MSLYDIIVRETRAACGTQGGISLIIGGIHIVDHYSRIVLS